MIIQCLKNKSKINLGDVTTTRDFNYVDDITIAFLKVINNKKSIGKVINIGSNYEISIKDLAKLIIQLTKSNSKLSFDKKE